MSFFSLVKVSTRGLVQAALAATVKSETYLDHALVWRLFPGDDRERDFIYRAERDEEGALSFYVVSERQPVGEEGVFSVQTKDYLPRLQVGASLHFQLRANPSVAIGQPERSHSQNHDVLMHAKRLAQLAGRSDVAKEMNDAAKEWLVTRAPGWGLTVEADKLVVGDYVRHKMTRKGREISFSTIDYSGVASVADPEKLATALCQGVGRHRGFGCGLLLVKRV